MVSLFLVFLFPLLVVSRETNSTRLFYLKSENDYIASYHTGAGLGDAVFQVDRSVASRGYLDGTRQLFEFETEFPWGLVMARDFYSGWSPVQINAGAGTPGFHIDENNHLQWDESQGFGGWLVCPWVHGFPQLFWINRYRDITPPSTCERTELTAEYI